MGSSPLRQDGRDDAPLLHKGLGSVLLHHETHTKGLKEGDEGGAEGGELLSTHSLPHESLPDVLKVGMPHHAILLHRLHCLVGGEEVGQDSLGQETGVKNHDV